MDRLIGMAEAKSKLADLVGQVAYGGKRFVLERRGRPMAVLIGVEEFERLKERAAAAATSTPSPLSPELRRRQETLVAQAHHLEAQLGDPVDRLARLLSTLPPDGDRFCQNPTCLSDRPEARTMYLVETTPEFDEDIESLDHAMRLPLSLSPLLPCPPCSL